MRLQLKLLVTHTALPNPTHSGVGNVPDLSPSCCREACTYGLAYLDKHAPDLAIMLRHVWTCASPGARYGQKAAITLARYIRDADGQSAMADNQKRAFRTKSHWGFSRLGQNLFLAASASPFVNAVTSAPCKNRQFTIRHTLLLCAIDPCAVQS
jgi:hypothetical protein|tara:strand:- start:86 stop:547 length:462 start_codon:yes stop_codon:yes gene_type:complete